MAAITSLCKPPTGSLVMTTLRSRVMFVVLFPSLTLISSLSKAMVATESKKNWTWIDFWHAVYIRLSTMWLTVIILYCDCGGVLWENHWRRRIKLNWECLVIILNNHVVYDQKVCTLFGTDRWIVSEVEWHGLLYEIVPNWKQNWYSNADTIMPYILRRLILTFLPLHKDCGVAY